MYTFQIFHNGYFLPLCTFLLPNKKTHTYVNMLQMLIAEGKHFNYMMLDFEQSMINALNRKFPSITIRGCRFHLGQNWWRSIQRYGLATEYKDRRSAAGKWLKLCFALPLIDVDMVAESFATHVLTAPAACKPFVDYLERYYVKPNSQFPPSMWAGLATSSDPATNNGIESYHNHFGNMFSSAHPNIRSFMSNLEMSQFETSLKTRGKQIKKTVKDYTSSHKQLKDNVITVTEFLHSVSKFNLPPSSSLRKKKTDK